MRFARQMRDPCFEMMYFPANHSSPRSQSGSDLSEKSDEVPVARSKAIENGR